jgi:HAD superfamily hydrolase (TIGR01459 family)
MQKFNNLLEIKDEFDIFIFDAFGVFYNGKNFFDNSIETMEQLMKDNKLVYILSNSPSVSEKSIENYNKKGLIKNKHYHDIITSGEYARHILINKELSFKKNKHPHKYYLFGRQNIELFKDTEFIQVDNFKDADFIYNSLILFNKDDYDKSNNEYKKYIVQRNETEYFLTSIDPIKHLLNDIIKTGLPIFSCNPDYKSIEGLLNGGKTSIITQGSIVKYLAENGMEVVEYGKPYKEIYEYMFNIVKKKINFDKNRICMVGDTLRTDIKGANNVGIKSVLCIETGITADELKQGGKNLEVMVKDENVVVDYVISSVGFINN